MGLRNEGSGVERWIDEFYRMRLSELLLHDALSEPSVPVPVLARPDPDLIRVFQEVGFRG